MLVDMHIRQGYYMISTGMGGTEAKIQDWLKGMMMQLDVTCVGAETHKHMHFDGAHTAT